MSDTKLKVKCIKFVLIGDKKVGKSSIINALVNKEFSKEYIPTSTIPSEKYSIPEVNNFVLKITDAPGDKQFKELIIEELENSHFVFIVFDITNKNSYDSINSWINDLDINNHLNHLDLVLIGNKLDLEKERKVRGEDASNFASKKNMKYYETSALNKVNIKKIFEESAKSCLQKKDDKSNTKSLSETDILNMQTIESINLDINLDEKNTNSNNKEKACCCCSCF